MGKLHDPFCCLGLREMLVASHTETCIHNDGPGDSVYVLNGSPGVTQRGASDKTPTLESQPAFGPTKGVQRLAFRCADHRHPP